MEGAAVGARVVGYVVTRVSPGCWVCTRTMCVLEYRTCMPSVE